MEFIHTSMVVLSLSPILRRQTGPALFPNSIHTGFNGSRLRGWESRRETRGLYWLTRSSTQFFLGVFFSVRLVPGFHSLAYVTHHDRLVPYWAIGQAWHWMIDGTGMDGQLLILSVMFRCTAEPLQTCRSSFAQLLGHFPFIFPSFALPLFFLRKQHSKSKIVSDTECTCRGVCRCNGRTDTRGQTVISVTLSVPK